MKIFIIGASGFIGTSVTKELLASGHEVVGLARSDASAKVLVGLGATTLSGSLEDLDSVRKGSSASDGVINLGFNHDFTQFAASAQIELNAVKAIGEVLKGTNRPLILASGGPVMDESNPFPEQSNAPTNPRMMSAHATLELSKHGVRSSVIRLAPCVHDETKCGFVNSLIETARKTGTSGYIGDGSNRWSAVHRLDAAHLFCLALEKAHAGSILQGVGEEGISLKEIAEHIRRRLNFPAAPVAREKAMEHFGWLGMLVGADLPATSGTTQKLLDWQPSHRGLIDDIDDGYLFDKI